MKIVIAHPSDPILPGSGGAVRWSINVATSLARLGHLVSLLGWQSQNNMVSINLPFEFIPVFRGAYSWKKYVSGLILKMCQYKIDNETVILTHRFDIMSAFVFLNLTILK